MTEPHRTAAPNRAAEPYAAEPNPTTEPNQIAAPKRTSEPNPTAVDDHTQIVTGLVLRAALLLAVAAAVAVSMIATSGWDGHAPIAVGLILLGVGAIAAPGGALPLVLLIAVTCCRLATGSGVDASLVLLVAVVPLIHRLTALTALIPAHARVPHDALRGAATRYLITVIPVECALAVVALTW